MRLRHVLVCLAGVGLGLVSLLVVHQGPDASLVGPSAVGAVALLTAGWALLAGGVGARARRPGSHFGTLLVAAGCVWFAVPFASPAVGSSLAFTVGLVTYALAPALVAHAALAYPDGRLSSWTERAALVIAYSGALLVQGLLPALVFQPAAQRCSQCPHNLVAVTSNPDLVAGLNRAGVWLGLGWSLALVAVAGWRTARCSPAARLVGAPVLLPAIAYLGLVAAEYAHSLSRGFLSNDDTDGRLWLWQAIALTVLVCGVVLTWARGWRARTVVARLVVELGEMPAGDELRGVLAHALSDPALELVYPVGDGSHVDAHGAPVELPSDDDRTATTLLRGGQPVAVLIMRADLRDDPALVAEVGAAARLALDHQRLQAQAQAHLRQLRASRARTVAAADAERRRLERDLHDGAQQRLVVLAFALRLLRPALGKRATARIDAADAELHQALAELRELAHGIYPAELTDEGLPAALDALAETAAVPIRIECVGDERLAPAVEAAAYFLVAEIVKRSSSTVRVHTSSANGRLLVEVHAAGALDGDIVDLEDRIGAVDGNLAVDILSIDDTRIRAEVPCAS